MVSQLKAILVGSAAWTAPRRAHRARRKRDKGRAERGKKARSTSVTNAANVRSRTRRYQSEYYLGPIRSTSAQGATRDALRTSLRGWRRGRLSGETRGEGERISRKRGLSAAN